MMDNDVLIQQLTKDKERNRQQFACTLGWANLLEDGKNLLPYFRDRQCKKIAIYGFAALGKLLLKELQKDSEIEVCFFMDRNATSDTNLQGIPVLSAEEFAEAPEVDMVVITAVAAFDSISRMLLREKPQVPIVSLSTIVEERISEEWQ